MAYWWREVESGKMEDVMDREMNEGKENKRRRKRE